MKLASLKSGRDGKLVVVSRDLRRYALANGIADTLQDALDRWAEAAPQLRDLAAQLEAGTVPANGFDESKCASPLPRAYQWADGSAYLNHVELVRKARGADVPETFYTDPLMYQGGSDSFSGPWDDIQVADEAYGIDLEAEVAVITDDVPMGISAADAASHIQLILLVNDVSLRNLIPGELAKGFGFFHGKPSSAFSPVAITPDELGAAWRDGKVHLPLLSRVRGEPFGCPNAGEEMTFNFFELVAHAAKTRPLCAGTIVGSGTVSNKFEGGPGRTIAQGGRGFSCLAEIRTIETLEEGTPRTPFLQFSDRVEIEMRDAEGHSIFGTIRQTVRPAQNEVATVNT